MWSAENVKSNIAKGDWVVIQGWVVKKVLPEEHFNLMFGLQFKHEDLTKQAIQMEGTGLSKDLKRSEYGVFKIGRGRLESWNIIDCRNWEGKGQ